MNSGKPTVDAELESLQRETFSYFLHETNPHNGLVLDKTASDWPASIAATGLALAVYPVAGPGLWPASMRLAMAISPSRESSSTEPISRRYMRTGSSVRSVGSLAADLAGAWA